MDFSNSLPIYEQIAHEIEARILKGVWKEGEKIMSMRELSLAFEVNPNTVARTLAFLADKDILDKKRGTGMYVASGAFASLLREKQDIFWKQMFPQMVQEMKSLGVTPEMFLEAFYKSEV